MVTTETHESQDLMVSPENQDQQELDEMHEGDQASPFSPTAGFDLEKISQGPVNAITVLTLLDKLVNMLDAVQENQHKMEVRNTWTHPQISCHRLNGVCGYNRSQV